MEHGKKFALIPVDRMQQFEDEHLSVLDSQIQHILKRKNTDDHEKAKLYIQILQKYVTFPDMNATSPSEEIIPTSSAENNYDKEKHSEKTSKYVEDIKYRILESVPAKYQKQAQKIIRFLEQHNISWSKDKELLQNGISIPGSKVDELINFLLRNRMRRPYAFDQFQEILNHYDFPQDFIKNAYLNGKKTMYAKPKSSKRGKRSSNNWLKL
jgi:hypothetical protein